jgi:hypothetical protein
MMYTAHDLTLRRASEKLADLAGQAFGTDVIAVLSDALCESLSRRVLTGDMALAEANTVLGMISTVVQSESTSHPAAQRH